MVGSDVPEGTSLDLREVYRSHFPFVWRTVSRLGVASGSVDDVVQEVFIVVHRRLSEFEGRSSLKTWIFGIVRRVVADHRRSAARRLKTEDVTIESFHDESGLRPDEALAEEEAFQLLNRVLDQLDEEKREVFILTEFEQITMAEIAEMLDINPNTISSRLRSARRDFEAALARQTTRDEWRST